MKLKAVFRDSYNELLYEYDIYINNVSWFPTVISRKELNLNDGLFLYVNDYYGYDFWSPKRNDDEA